MEGAKYNSNLASKHRLAANKLVWISSSSAVELSGNNKNCITGFGIFFSGSS